jgi:Putative lumazine-binding
MSARIAALLLLVPAVAGAQTAAGDTLRAKREVVEVAQRVMDAMATKDTAKLLSAFAPGASLWGVRPKDGGSVLQQLKAEEFAAYVARDTRGKWEEPLGEAEVRIDGPLATVWVPYEFYLAGKFSHCGIDAFQLLRLKEGWKIVSLADTYRTENCEKSGKKEK